LPQKKQKKVLPPHSKVVFLDAKSFCQLDVLSNGKKVFFVTDKTPDKSRNVS
jgi:hypothetical protein